MGTNMSALLGACLVKCRWRTRLRVSERHQQLCEEKQSVPCGFWGRSNTATTATKLLIELADSQQRSNKKQTDLGADTDQPLFCLVSSCTLAPGMATVGASSTARRVSRVKRVSRETMMKPTDPTDPTAQDVPWSRGSEAASLRSMQPWLGGSALGTTPGRKASMARQRAARVEGNRAPFGTMMHCGSGPSHIPPLSSTQYLRSSIHSWAWKPEHKCSETDSWRSAKTSIQESLKPLFDVHDDGKSHVWILRH